MKRVNAITSFGSGRLIDHDLKTLWIFIQFSPSLSLSSLPKNDSTSRNATNGTIIDSFSIRPTDLVDPRKTKQEESKKGDGTSQPSTVERVHKPSTPFPNRLRDKKDQTQVAQVKINISFLDAVQ